MKILIIEDEPELSRSIAAYLEGEQYLCETAPTYEAALDKVLSFDYDCILLDVMLPGGSGIQILRELKRMNKQDGVIIISAKGALEERIAGLQIGADDYLAKPFHLSELSARILSVIRRRQFASANVIRFNELEIDLSSRRVLVKTKEINLTRKEFDLLLFLLGNKGKVVSKSAIAEHLSGEMADTLESYDFIYTHLKNLKRKLSEPGCIDYIRTVYGLGYKWEVL